MFSVKSVYDFSLDEAYQGDVVGSTVVPDGSWACWRMLRPCGVPPRYPTLPGAWPQIHFQHGRISANRGLEVTVVCLLCGTGVEDNYHPFCQCPLARDLWRSMSSVWQLPALNNARHIGKEWLLHFLDPLFELERSMVLMIFWRCWHIRNEIIHDKVPRHLLVSKDFLCSYLDSLLTVKNERFADP